MEEQVLLQDFIKHRPKGKGIRILLFDDGTKMLFKSKAKALQKACAEVDLECVSCGKIYRAWLWYKPSQSLVRGYCPYCLGTYATVKILAVILKGEKEYK